VNVHRRWSQIATVKAMTITADSLLSRPKLDCDVAYDTAVKGVSVVVRGGTAGTNCSVGGISSTGYPSLMDGVIKS
jgi:hypothetical protein